MKFFKPVNLPGLKDTRGVKVIITTTTIYLFSNNKYNSNNVHANIIILIQYL